MRQGRHGEKPKNSKPSSKPEINKRDKQSREIE
jgi:hypothetical protein